MCPARRLGNRPRHSVRFVEFVVAAKSIRLQNAGIFSKVSLRMFAASVAGIIEHCRRRRGATEGAIITDIHPTAGEVGLALGQHRHVGVIAMQARARKDKCDDMR